MTDVFLNREGLQPPSQTETFSNYSVYFLQQNNGLSVNCSVYSLTLGTLSYQNYFTEEWINNASLFLPAYYITNCSVEEVLTQIRRENITSEEVDQWMADFQSNPYNISNNGDMFVALLFTFLGLCVLAWMLLLLHLLLPRHKRKPFLTILATLVYSIVLTIILAQITQTTEDEYYRDSLDMVKIMSVLIENRYPYALAVLHFLICLAYIQLLWKMVKLNWRWKSTAFAGSLVLTSFILSLVSISLIPSPFHFTSTISDKPFKASISASIAFIIWFCLCLVYHTFKAKSPLVTYAKKLLPLAILTWFMMIARIVISLLLVTLWNSDWLIGSWLSYIPNMLDIYLLTCSWEWLYLIKQMEQKIELSGMLGRRISIDDVMNFSNDWNQGNSKKDYKSILTWMRDKFNLIKNFRNSKGPETAASDSARSPNASANANTNTNSNANNIGRHLSAHDSDAETDHVELQPMEPITSGPDHINAFVINLDEASVCEVHHGGSDIWDSDSDAIESSHDRPASNTDVVSLGEPTNAAPTDTERPPPFVPLPGHSADDYWDDKR